MATDSKANLKDLLIKRSSIKGQLTKFRNYLDKFSKLTEINNLAIAELSLKISKLEGISVKFDSLQTDIEVMNSQNILIELDERERIETEIIQCLAESKFLIQEYNNQNKVDDINRRQSTSTAGCEHQEVNFKLPQIQVSKFDGSLFRWLEFRDTFTSLVHKNDRIADIHKFHYLLSYLEGDAARIISNLEISSANYKEAWLLLCERYDNKRILINNHLDSLFNVQQITRESERSLRFLVDHVTKNLRALASLGQPTDHWDLLIIYIVSSKLDNRTIVKWEEYRNSLEDVPSLDQFNKFLIDRADVLESINRNNSKFIHNVNNNQHTKQQHSPRPLQLTNHFRQNQNKFNSYADRLQNTKSFVSTEQGAKSSNFLCIICNGNHKIYDCQTFKSKSIKERLSYVSQYKLCTNCLRQGHPYSECRMGPCRQCNQKHNTLLHDPTVSVNYSVDEEQRCSVVAFSQHQSKQVLLSTAMIDVVNPNNNKTERVRALLDSGSQSSFITKSLQDKLNLECHSLDAINIIGIGNKQADKVMQSCVVQLNSMYNSYTVKMSCYILNELTGNIPKYPISIEGLKFPKDILLADPKFYQSAPIDILMGADIFWDILGQERHSLGSDKPKLHSSKFGWIMAGPILQPAALNCLQCNYVGTANIDKMLTKFWEIEELPLKKFQSPEDLACENHFLNNTIRLNTGRFCVKLPLKSSPDCLGDSYHLAKKRLLSLEKRFRKNPKLKVQYVNFMREYSDLGHLSELTSTPNSNYYLCHHAVLKEDSESTKIRVVFDGSAPTTSGYSVNDILMVGPNLQDSLFSILLRARQYKFLLTGDIAKMYRQVLVHEDDCNLQLILWREDESQPIKTLRLGTLTYGTASASYLSTRCLWQVGEECQNDLIKEIIQKDFYVDDAIMGADDEAQLRYIQNAVSEALLSACFQLRKYKTNLPSIFKNIKVDNSEVLTFSESSSTLGLGWDPSNDEFHFPVRIFADNDNVTKRNVLSNAFRIFDPLGLLSPCIIQPKILLQKLWSKGIGWDEPLPGDLKEEWYKISKNLPLLSLLHIPRRVLCDSPLSIELHSFSDASQCAYGACIYLKSVDKYNKVTVSLLCSKSKVAPLKPTTIPRLELCAALLAARLCKNVLDSIRYVPSRIVHWCDSSIVLCWINSDPSKLKTFVANRIAEIIDISDRSSWRYVPTELNPADLISRGMNTSQLQGHKLWWSGPPFLYLKKDRWPTLNKKQALELPELKVLTITCQESLFDFKNYSKFNKLHRIMAYVLRFVHNANPQNKSNKYTSVLTVDELSNSFNLMCRISQKQSFSAEYKRLEANKDVESKSKILSLSPFFDSTSNLIRVGGRLDCSNYSYDKRHPILLDSSHHITKLYFEQEHLRNLHAGPQLLLSTIRERVWPINGRKLARHIVRKCVVCTRIRGKTILPKMGNLPLSRISVDFPFNSVGVDYAGPFNILNRKGRGAKLVKCYLSLFVCMRYKCVHLEPVSDLTKDAYIMTLRRFVARRGKPKEMFSDNGRNFVAAAKDISNFLKINNENLSEFASTEGIRFNFIPAYTPHFGGLWEAGVKSAKYHIKRVIGNTHLTFEEIGTLFAQVEAILNSRPLCPMSSSPNDLLFLSPGHFIIGRPLNDLPTSYVDLEKNNLQRYSRLQQIRLHFWKRWKKEYISEMQQRTKWRTNNMKLSIGDMVLLQEDNVAPMNWRLGRVARLYPGSDGTTRVADVNTTNGCVRRSLVRLCPLPSAEQL